MAEEIIHAIRRCRELLKEAKTRKTDANGFFIPQRQFSKGPIEFEWAAEAPRSGIRATVGLRKNPYAHQVSLHYPSRGIGPNNHFKGKIFTVAFHNRHTSNLPVHTEVSARFLDYARHMGYSVSDDSTRRNTIATFKWRGKPVARLAKDATLLGDIYLFAKPRHVEKLVRMLFTQQLPEAAARKQLSAPRSK